MAAPFVSAGAAGADEFSRLLDVRKASEIAAFQFPEASFADEAACRAWIALNAPEGFTVASVEKGGGVFRVVQFEAEPNGAVDAIEMADGVKAMTGTRAAAAGPQPGVLEFRFGAVKSVDRRTGKVGGYASFKTKDRHITLVLPSAFTKTLDKFNLHPVMLMGHEYDSAKKLPIGRFNKLTVKADGLYIEEGELRKSMPDFAEILECFEMGLLAWSVGFIPVKWRKPTEAELKTYGDDLMLVYEEVELVEISAVSVPSNRESLAQLRAAARGLRVDAAAGEWDALVAELAGTLRTLKAAGEKPGADACTAAVEAIVAGARSFVVVLNDNLDAILKAHQSEQADPDAEPEGDTPPDPNAEEKMAASLKGLLADASHLGGGNITA